MEGGDGAGGGKEGVTVFYCKVLKVLEFQIQYDIEKLTLKIDGATVV